MCEETIGSFIKAKRTVIELSARQLAIKLDISPVYMCDFEKNRRAIPTDILDKLAVLLKLDQGEAEQMYDLAAKAKNTVSADLPEYIMEKDIVRAALRVAKKHNIDDKEWEAFIKKIIRDDPDSKGKG